MSTAPHIRFEAVSLGFAPQGPLALEGITLTVARGEVVTVLGPSGCGKTTLLRLIAGLLRPDSGRVEVNGAAPRPGRESAVVFQNFRLLPWQTIEGNLAFVLPHLPAAERRARIARYLELVGLSRFARSYPRALSGGMQQRVALARALAAEPQILLMDEPFASLDAQARELMGAEVLQLARAGGAGERRTIVFVTHSVDEALALGDRVLLMSPRPGRLAEVLPLPFARQPEPRQHPAYAPLRARLWGRLREMVLSDPDSDFHGRHAPGGTAAPPDPPPDAATDSRSETAP